jgi:hypothetical protein
MQMFRGLNVKFQGPSYFPAFQIYIPIEKGMEKVHGVVDRVHGSTNSSLNESCWIADEWLWSNKMKGYLGVLILTIQLAMDGSEGTMAVW